MGEFMEIEKYKKLKDDKYRMTLDNGTIIDIYEDVIVKNIFHSDSYVKITLETEPTEHICPVCGNITKRIHDYRMQTIKDLPFQLKHCYLILRKR